MAADFFHSVIHVPDDAFSRDIVEICLRICRIGELYAVRLRHLRESPVVLRSPHLYGVPRLRFDFK